MSITECAHWLLVGIYEGLRYGMLAVLAGFLITFLIVAVRQSWADYHPRAEKASPLHGSGPVAPAAVTPSVNTERAHG